MRSACAGRIQIQRPFGRLIVSSLDDTDFFKPSMHFFTSHAQDWDAMNDDLPKHPLYPPA